MVIRNDIPMVTREITSYDDESDGIPMVMREMNPDGDERDESRW